MRHDERVVEDGAFASVRIKHGNNPEESYIFDEPGTYNRTFTSSTYVHGGFPQTFFLSLSANFQPSLEFFAGTNASGSADFGSTLELIGVELRNADTGELLPAGTLTTASGATVPIVVPEPAGIFIGLGAVALARIRRR